MIVHRFSQNLTKTKLGPCYLHNTTFTCLFLCNFILGRLNGQNKQRTSFILYSILLLFLSLVNLFFLFFQNKYKQIQPITKFHSCFLRPISETAYRTTPSNRSAIRPASFAATGFPTIARKRTAAVELPAALPSADRFGGSLRAPRQLFTTISLLLLSLWRRDSV